MKKDTVHLTFETDRSTSEMLKFFAHNMGKKQPELINEICKDFIEMMCNYLDEKMKETPNTQ